MSYTVIIPKAMSSQEIRDFILGVPYVDLESTESFEDTAEYEHDIGNNIMSEMEFHYDDPNSRDKSYFSAMVGEYQDGNEHGPYGDICPCDRTVIEFTGESLIASKAAGAIIEKTGGWWSHDDSKPVCRLPPDEMGPDARKAYVMGNMFQALNRNSEELLESIRNMARNPEFKFVDFTTVDAVNEHMAASNIEAVQKFRDGMKPDRSRKKVQSGPEM